MNRFFSVSGALAALLLSVSASALTIDVTGYDSATDKVSFSFTGVERDLSLFALWDDGDKGPVPCAYAETWPMGEIAAGTTTAAVALPAGLDASKGCVRFVLADLGGATPIRSLSSTADGCEWVDTQIRPSKDATVTVVCRGPKNVNMFGIATWCYLFNNNFAYFWGAGQTKGADSPFVAAYNVKRMMTVSRAGAFIDGAEVGGTVSTDTSKVAPDCSLALFARRDPGNPSGITTASRGACTIFSAEVKEDDTYAGYVIPCIKDDVLQMYDLVNRRFLTNCGTGAFEADRLVALNVSEPIDGLVAVSDVLKASVPSPSRSIAVKSIDWATGAVTLTVAKGRRTSYLYVARNTFDAGLLASNWSAVRALGEVAADATEATCTIPSDMRASEGVLRFFLSSQAQTFVPVYDWLIPEGDVYVDTGYRPTNTDVVTVKIRSLDAETFKGGVFCARKMKTKLFTALVQSADRIIRVDRSGGNKYGPALAYETDYNIVADYKSLQVIINGTSSFELTSGTTEQMENTLLLLANHDVNTDIPSNFGKMRLGGFRLADKNGVVKLDLKPRVKDGVACLYDAVSKRYLPNSGTGRFTVGQPIGSLGVDPELFKIESATSPIAVCQPKVSAKANAEQGRITIRLGAHNRAGRVFLTGGARDFGSRLSDWPNWLLAGNVSAQENELVVDIPVAWKESKCKVFRAFFATMEADLCAVAGVSSDGRAWIDTGLLPDADTTVTIRARLGGRAFLPMFGIERWLYLFNNGSFCWGLPGIPQPTGSRAMGGIDMTATHTYKVGAGGVWLDDTDLGACTTTGSRTTLPTCNLSIFARATDIVPVASGVADDKIADCTVYWARVERNGTLVSDLQPCKWKGKPCLYDRVRKLPLMNAIPESGGKFTLESATATPLDEEILSVSPVCSLTRGLVILVF